MLTQIAILQTFQTYCYRDKIMNFFPRFCNFIAYHSLVEIKRLSLSQNTTYLRLFWTPQPFNFDQKLILNLTKNEKMKKCRPICKKRRGVVSNEESFRSFNDFSLHTLSKFAQNPYFFKKFNCCIKSNIVFVFHNSNK